MSEELISIAATIGDRTYPIKVASRHEQLVRDNLELINQQLGELQKQFGGKEMRDYLAMTLLWFVNQPLKTAPHPLEGLGSELELLERLLDAEINKH